MRLKLMASLRPLPVGEALDFPRLKKLLNASDGNVGSHLATLEKAGYVHLEKGYSGKRPSTAVSITSAGRAAYDGHVAYLRQIIEDSDGSA